MNQKGFSNILIIFLVVVLAGAVGYFALHKSAITPTPITEQPPIQTAPDIKKSVAVGKLITGDSIHYTVEELDQQIKIITVPTIKEILPEGAKKSCLNQVSNYTYAFPGYKYEKIEGVIRQEEPKEWNKGSNVLVSFQGSGLISKEIAKNDAIDTYEVYLFYDKALKSCEIKTQHFFNYIIPKKIYDLSLSLAMQDKSVADFVKNPESVSLGWIDEFKGPYTNDAKELASINFKRPAKGIVKLYYRNSQYYDLFVYVDVFNAEVFTKGPIYNPPR